MIFLYAKLVYGMGIYDDPLLLKCVIRENTLACYVKTSWAIRKIQNHFSRCFGSHEIRKTKYIIFLKHLVHIKVSVLADGWGKITW